MARPSLSDEERTQRRVHLLAAARPLFRAARELPSVAAIAAAAAVAKGAVYLSFASKEEIFIALLEDSFSGLLGQLNPVLLTLPASPGSAAETFSAAYTKMVSGDQDLLPLAGMANAVFERNLPLPAMLTFKEGLARGLGSAAGTLSRSALRVDLDRGTDLLLRTWSMTLGHWQTLDHPKELRPYLRRGTLSVFNRNFQDDLRQAVRAVWIGSLASVK
jgi:AcrR family transcriptional regulator